jgi:hypothetical protein
VAIESPISGGPDAPLPSTHGASTAEMGFRSGGRKELEGDGRRLGSEGGERFGSQPEVLEDLPRHIGLLDAGDEAHLALTARTLEHIDAEDPLQ